MSRFRARLSACRTASASWRARASAGQLRVCRVVRGAEPDADLRPPSGPTPSHALANGLVGVRPAPLPQGELGDISVVRRQAGLVANHRTRSLLMQARRVEVGRGRPRERHAGREACAGSWRWSRARRVGAGVVGPVPFADRQQRLDPVRREDGDVDPVPAHRGEPLLADLGGLSWPSEHRQHVGDRDVDPVEGMRVADSLGDLAGPGRGGRGRRRRDRGRRGCCRASSARGPPRRRHRRDGRARAPARTSPVTRRYRQTICNPLPSASRA